jgi:hypothetical protein
MMVAMIAVAVLSPRVTGLFCSFCHFLSMRRAARHFRLVVPQNVTHELVPPNITMDYW